MQQELLRQVIGLEYQALALVAAPLTSVVAGWLLRQVGLHVRDRRAAGYAARLVAWAEQAIPAKSARYGEVAALLARRFPMLSGEQLEVLIESEVLGLKAALRTPVTAGGHGSAPPLAGAEPVAATARAATAGVGIVGTGATGATGATGITGTTDATDMTGVAPISGVGRDAGTTPEPALHIGGAVGSGH